MLKIKRNRNPRTKQINVVLFLLNSVFNFRTAKISSRVFTKLYGIFTNVEKVSAGYSYLLEQEHMKRVGYQCNLEDMCKMARG